MSHSEIAGSKLAHSSPTLIAACHVLHRLYMPRHSPDALTSRLRVHTTNDSTGESAASACNRCGDLTQPDNHLCTIIARFHPIRRSSENRTMSPRHRLKNPFTMSKRPASADHIAGRIRQTATLHLWKSSAAAPRNIAAQYFGGAYRDRTDDLMLAKQPLSQLS